MSNPRFTQDGQVVHRARNPFPAPGLEDERMPAHVGNIISTEWLAQQMGLPIEDVRERIEAAERRDRESRPISVL